MTTLQQTQSRPAPAPIALRPSDSAPPASAPYEERADWSERYVAWFLAQTPSLRNLPPDVDDTHRYQVEFNSCVRNPRAYERHTQEELSATLVH